MKITKLKNVSAVDNSDGLISISCDHERRGTDIYDEYYFLNNKFDVVAHFYSSFVMHAEQMSKLNECIFAIDDWSKGDDVKTQIVRVNPDLSYEVLHEVNCYEAGIEDGTFAIKKDNKYGFIDYNGNEIIKPQYEDYCAFKNGYACVKKSGKWGFINKNNEVVIPFEYDLPAYCDDNPIKYCGYSSFTMHEGKFMAEIAKGDKWGIIDFDNNVILPFKYDWLFFNSTKYIVARFNNKWGFIDINDNVLVPFIYDSLEIDENNLQCYIAVKDGLTGILSFDKGVIIPCAYNKLEPYHNTVCAQKQNGKYVLLDYNNNELTKEYYYINPYPENGMYYAGTHKKHCGYINEKDEVIIPFKYRQHSLKFKGGLALAEYYDFEKGVDVINTNGEVLYHAKRYRDVFNLGNGYILARNGNREFEFVKIL